MRPVSIMKYARALSLLAAFFFTLLHGASALDNVFPGKTWERISPAEAGLDKAKLEEAARYLGGRGCVTRYGRVVHTWGKWDKPGDVASAAKPWYSALLFKAVETGKIPSLDARVSDYVPELKKINAALNHKDANITFRHMANQISCYGMAEAPGAAYDYNDWQMTLFVDALVEKVYGSSHARMDADVLRPLLADAIGCEDAPTMLAFGTGDRAGRLSVSPRDFARFGFLFLSDGVWNGRRVLSAEHVRLALHSPLPNSIPRAGAKAAEMLPGQRSIGSREIPDNQTDHYGCYSWLWWLNGVDRGGNRRWPSAPVDTFTALGHKNGQRGMAVLPGPEIVISWNDTTLGNRPEEPHPLDPVFRLLMEAAVDAPMNGQVVARPDNPRHLARFSPDGKHAPLFLCGPGDPEDFLYRGKRQPDSTRHGDQDAILDKMQGTGANCIYFQAIRSHGGDGDRTHNPFVDSDPKKALDENMLDQWDGWLTRMDELAIVALFFIYDDNARVWNTGDKVGPDEEKFLRTLVDRFERHRNLVWCVAEEYEEALSPERVRRIAAIVRQADEHNHAIAVHKLNGLDFAEFADDPNIDQFAVQHNEKTPEALHAGLVAAWTAANGRYGVNLSEVAEHGFGLEASRKHWAAAMSGACGVMALTWLFDAPDAPSRDDLEAAGRVARFFEATDFQEMAPSDARRLGDTRYVLARPDGLSYIVYAEGGAKPLGIRDMDAGLYALRWHSVETGREIAQEAVRVSAGDRLFPRPDGMRGDVAVWIRKTKP